VQPVFWDRPSPCFVSGYFLSASRFARAVASLTATTRQLTAVLRAERFLPASAGITLLSPPGKGIKIARRPLPGNNEAGSLVNPFLDSTGYPLNNDTIRQKNIFVKQK